MEKQDDLFVEIPEYPQDNGTKSLLEVCNKRNKGYYQLPDFQRDFVWTDKQIIGWIESIISQKAIGVVVTYQLRGGGLIYIADGRQRITATQKFIADPQRYGFNFGTEQAEAKCDAFNITLQHRIYDSHEEAWEAFQRLNQGTTLTPYEFHVGRLMLSVNGKHIVDDVPTIVSNAESPYIHAFSKSSRDKEHALRRDSYSLYFQYITQHTNFYFSDAGTKRILSAKDVKPIEWQIMNEIADMREDELIKSIRHFGSFIQECAVEIATLLAESGGAGHAIPPTLFRWLLHLSIWRKNARRPVSVYQDFVRKLFSHMISENGKLNSNIIVKDGNNVMSATLQIGKLNHLLAICRALKSDLHTGVLETKKRVPMSAGYNDSHILPFSTNGNGKTIPESAIRNRARGARPMEVEH